MQILTVILCICLRQYSTDTERQRYPRPEFGRAERGLALRNLGGYWQFGVERKLLPQRQRVSRYS